MYVDNMDVGAVVQALARAQRVQAPIEVPSLDLDQAYAVQAAWGEGRDAAVVGYKVAFTSAVTQQSVGATEPAFGLLFDDVLVPNGDAVPTAELITPRVEAEVAMVLSRDVPDPGMAADDARLVVAAIRPAIEIADSRLAGRMTFAGVVADNASAGRVVLGEEWTPIGDLDLAGLRVTVTKGNEEVATGTGAAVLGDPLASLAWLADALLARGRMLRADDVVMTGAFHAPVKAAAGERFEAVFSHLGSVRVAFA